MQRTGTTSVGKFFKNFGYKVAGWPEAKKNKWSYCWEQGDFEKIFKSKDFINNQVFEDDPWWFPDFYKILFHSFPNSKFILFTRGEKEWFNSMLSHSNGKTLGNTRIHCKIYKREKDFLDLFPLKSERVLYNARKTDNLLDLKGHEAHYKNLYITRNIEIKDYFALNAPESLFIGELEDPQKWKKLAQFMTLKVTDDFEVHANRSNQ
jgi:hypothetical protein